MYIYPPPKSIVKDNVKEAMDIPSKIFLTIKKSKPCSHTLIGLHMNSKNKLKVDLELHPFYNKPAISHVARLKF